MFVGDDDGSTVALAVPNQDPSSTKLMPATEGLSTASTALLKPQGVGVTAATANRTDAEGAPPREPKRRKRGRVTASIVAAVLAVVVAIVVAVVIAVSGSTGSTPVEYPEVPGTVGEHLSELQDSVTP